MFLFLLTNEWWGGIRPSAGVVLPLLPPALLHYTINRRKLQAVRQKICAKKAEMLGGVPCAAPARPAVHVPDGGQGGGCSPCGTCYSCPGGEDHLKRRSSSPPVPPLLGCRHFPWKGGSFGFASHRRLFAWGARMAETVSAANGLMQGCRGRSPRRNKLIVSPFPTGEGGRGDRGQESKPKAGLAGEEKGKPPCGCRNGKVGRRPPACATPPGTCLAGSVSAANGLMQGCRGRSPRRNKLRVSPFPTGEGGWGDRGQERKPKAG